MSSNERGIILTGGLDSTETSIKQEFQMCKDLSSDKSEYLGMLRYKKINLDYVSNLPNKLYENLVESHLIPTTWQLLIKAKNDRKDDFVN